MKIDFFRKKNAGNPEDVGQRIGQCSAIKKDGPRPQPLCVTSFCQRKGLNKTPASFVCPSTKGPHSLILELSSVANPPNTAGKPPRLEDSGCLSSTQLRSQRITCSPIGHRSTLTNNELDFDWKLFTASLPPEKCSEPQ